jgi:DNA-binding beta-propeller fold protein YncE
VTGKTHSLCRQYALLVTVTIAVTLAVSMNPGTAAAAPGEPTFMYKLSNFNGPLTSTWAGISLDEQHDEIYLVDNGQVIVFNDVGMEIYRFGEGGSLGMIEDVAVTAAGDILVLSRTNSRQTIRVCNFRGEPAADLQLAGLPPAFSDLSPRRMIHRHDRLYLMDPIELKIVVTDDQGRFMNGYDVADLAAIEPAKRGISEIDGFSVDDQGDMLFTIPVRFAAYRLLPDGTILSFGQPGSGPGRFNLVAGIVADENGNYYVADRLKSVVQVFDSGFNYRMQFGGRGPLPYNLVGPKQLVLDSRGRLYVSQLRGRGVSVFKIKESIEQP